MCPKGGLAAPVALSWLPIHAAGAFAYSNGDLARLTVPRLQKIEGVRTADVSGGSTQHVAILPREGALAAAGLTVGDISSTLEDNGALFPVGSLEDDPRSLTIQAGSRIGSTGWPSTPSARDQVASQASSRRPVSTSTGGHRKTSSLS